MDEFNQHIAKATEEVNRRNVQAAVDHSNSSRKLIQELREEVQELKDMVAQQDMEIAQIREMITGLLVQTFNGGATE